MYRYLKYVLFTMIVVFGCVQTSFSSYQDKMYCKIDKNSVVISLDDKKLYTCKSYISYVETQMKKVYKDILVIQKYIDKQQDLGYWKPLKDEKVAFLNNLQKMRLNILSHMKTFEGNLLQTSQKYFLESIADYRKKLNRSLKNLRGLQDVNSQKYLSLIQQQLDTIDAISQATTFDKLNAYMQRYVYFKQQLSGK